MIIQPSESDDLIFIRHPNATQAGFLILKTFKIEELLHTRSTWEAMGVKKGALPLITFIDPVTSMEHEDDAG